MNEPFLMLGIESSCDETAAALVKGDGTILASEIASQMEVHAAHGGVVPEIAARAHLDAIDRIIALIDSLPSSPICALAAIGVWQDPSR